MGGSSGTDRQNTEPFTPALSPENRGRQQSPQITGCWTGFLPPLPGVRGFFLLALTLLLLTITPANAHSQLLSSEPAPGETLDFPPYQIVLNFNEPMGEPTRVLLIDENFVSTNLETTIEDMTLISQMPALGGGVFTIQYDAVSADGHPISGSYEFAVVLSGGTGMTTGTGILIGGTTLLILVMMFFHFRSRNRIRQEVRLQQAQDRNDPSMR